MKQKTFILLVVAIVLVGGAIGGAFIGGVTLGKSRERATSLNSIRSQFTSRQGQTGTVNGTTAAVPTFPDGTGFPGRGTAGTVTKNENGVITLTTLDNKTVTITTSASTTVQKTGTVNLSDIKVGESISVSGETQPDGSVKATSILVTPAGTNPTPSTRTNPTQ